MNSDLLYASLSQDLGPWISRCPKQSEREGRKLSSCCCCFPSNFFSSTSTSPGQKKCLEELLSSSAAGVQGIQLLGRRQKFTNLLCEKTQYFAFLWMWYHIWLVRQHLIWKVGKFRYRKKAALLGDLANWDKASRREKEEGLQIYPHPSFLLTENSEVFFLVFLLSYRFSHSLGAKKRNWENEVSGGRKRFFFFEEGGGVEKVIRK